MVANTPISCKTLGELYGLDGKRFREQYVSHLSDYKGWQQATHAEDWLLFSENMDEYLSIDETSLSQGKLYTILTNKAAKGRKGTLVAMIRGTESEKIIQVLHQIPESARKKVKEVTLDLAPTMEKIVRRAFPKSKLVADRFHVQQLACDAVQEIRIQNRWQAMEEENRQMQSAKEQKIPFTPEVLENGDTLKQLLARSRYLLYKKQHNWSESQVHRAQILFRLYRDIAEAYGLSRGLSDIFTHSKERIIAFKKLALWYNQVEKASFDSFN